MKIYVLVKQVPDTESKIKLAANNQGIDPAGIKWVMNPYDEFAVEEAIKTRDANAGSQVVVVGLGPKVRVVETLRTALAMGADEGIVINSAESLDPLATAQALAKAIQAEGPFDLIFSGKVAIDDNASSVSQMVGELLQIPHATVVSKITKEASSLTIERDVEGGAKEVISLQLPAIVAANKGLNLPRYANLQGIMKAKKKPIKEIECASLGITAAQSKTSMSDYSLPADKPPVKQITGEPAQQVSQLVQLLRDEAKVL